jgi:hypothetical protein
MTRISKLKDTSKPKTLALDECVADETIAAPTPVPPARAAMNAGANSAVVMQEFGAQVFGEQDIDALMKELVPHLHQAIDGDLGKAKALLMGQAMALQSMFTHMSRRVLKQKYQRHCEAFFGMALKAQNQCRMTLETLNELTHPRSVFVRAEQANIATGPQQINNAVAPASKLENRPNELLEQRNGERLEFGTASASGSADSMVATLGAVKRTANGRG